MKIFLAVAMGFLGLVQLAGAAPPVELGYFKLPGNRMVADPIRPRVYIVTLKNTLAVIDTSTLGLLDEFFIGSSPVDLSVSLDGSKLIVGNSGTTASGLAVVDLRTLKLIKNIATPEPVFDVAAGWEDRAFASLNGQWVKMEDVDLATGEMVPFEGNWYYTRLELSPNGRNLLGTDTSSSPANYYRFSTETTPPKFEESIWDAGENAQDLVISHDGQTVSFIAGYGYHGYTIPIFAIDDINSVLGSLPVGAYPSNGAFTLNDRRYFSSSQAGTIKIFDTSTFQEVNRFPTHSRSIGQFVTDSTNRYLLSVDDRYNLNEKKSVVGLYTTGQERLAKLAGVYHGIRALDRDVPFASVRLDFDAAGKFSGEYRESGVTTPFKGHLDVNGQANIKITHGEAKDVLGLATNAGPWGEILFAAFKFGKTGEPLSLFKETKFTNGKTTKLAGDYNFTLREPRREVLGLGVGYGHLSVSPEGAISLTGQTGDGVPFSTNTELCQSDTAIIHASLGEGEGHLAGQVRFREVDGVHDLEGSLRWVPAGHPGEETPIVRHFQAARYVAPPDGTNVFPAAAGTLELVADSIPNATVTPVTFGPNNAITPGNPNPYDFHYAVNPADGTVSGTFVVDQVTIPFSGVVNQKSGLAYALFQSANGFGTVLLKQTP